MTLYEMDIHEGNTNVIHKEKGFEDEKIKNCCYDTYAFTII